MNLHFKNFEEGDLDYYLIKTLDKNGKVKDIFSRSITGTTDAFMLADEKLSDYDFVIETDFTRDSIFDFTYITRYKSNTCGCKKEELSPYYTDYHFYSPTVTGPSNVVVIYKPE